jgi:hypothetical protein
MGRKVIHTVGKAALTSQFQERALGVFLGLPHPDCAPADFSNGGRDCKSRQLEEHSKFLAFKPLRASNRRHPETESAEHSDNYGRYNAGHEDFGFADTRQDGLLPTARSL